MVRTPSPFPAGDAARPFLTENEPMSRFYAPSSVYRGLAGIAAAPAGDRPVKSTMSSEIPGKPIPLYQSPLTGKDVLIRDECPGGPGRPLAPGGCPRRRWLASRRVAGGRRPAAAVVHRWLLDRAGSQAERGLLDFLTIEDGLDLQSDDRFQADSRSPPAPGMHSRPGRSPVTATSRAAYCRLCWAAPELVLTCTAITQRRACLSAGARAAPYGVDGRVSLQSRMRLRSANSHVSPVLTNVSR